MTDQLRKAAEMALDALENVYGKGKRCEAAITVLRQALAQPKQPHPDHYAEVYIRVGELHVKKILTQIELSQAYDPIKLLSLVADDCIQTLKELS